MNRALLQQALDVLEDSVDLVSNHYQEYIDLYSKYPTRAARIDGKLTRMKAHKNVIKALRAELAKPEPEPYGYVSVHRWLSGDVRHEFHFSLGTIYQNNRTSITPVYTKGTQNA